MLFDINRYSDDELLNISNMISAVFLLDQEIDEQELMRRLKKIIYILKKISPEQFSVFKKWLKNIVKPRVRDNLQGEIDDVLEKSNQEEVDFMVSNLGKTIERMQDKAIERGLKKGIEQGIEQTAKKAIEMGMDNEIIMNLTGLSEEQINTIRQEKSH